MLLRETGLAIDAERSERLRRLHASAFKRHAGDVRPLPGAPELLAYLTGAEIPWAIATSGRMETARSSIETLAVDFQRTAIVIRDQVKFAKPDPDLFLTAAERLGVAIANAFVVGDSVWDMLAAPRPRTRHRSSIGRLWPRGIGARGRVSRLRRSGRSPGAQRRSRRKAVIFIAYCTVTLIVV
jgi:phosphoglycolate phosphatase-like HAD superfamily hydrolase